MRKRKIVCKTTAMLLSAAMAVAGTPMYGQIRVNAAETERAQNEFRFGSAQTRLTAGEYLLPVSLMRNTDITSASMAGSCIKDGKLTVNQDGTADITVNLQAVTVLTISGWASDWNIYTGDLNGEKKAAEYTVNEEGHVDSITFRLPENTMDGVYVEMFISAMNSSQQAYLAFDFASLGGGAEAEWKTGSAKVEQFGGYDVNVGVSVLEGLITDLKVEGANFDGTYAEYNQTKLQAAAEGLKVSYTGKSATNAKEIEGVDAVSGATYSSEAIRSAVLDALGLEASGEEITLPTQKLAEGTYQVDIAFYTDGVKHSLVEDDKASAAITVDAKGNMTLTVAVVNGTEKEPLYIYEFNGYYEGNDVNNTLKAMDQVKKEDTDFTDDVFGADEQVVTEVSFPLEGGFAEVYTANASIYVPAMKNLTGELAGITFDRGRFSSDCFAKVYWDSLRKTDSESGFGSRGIELGAGVYTLPISMKNATDISKDSMAGSCLKGASLTVKPDGSADVTVDLTAVSVMGQTAWSSDWQIYQGQDTDSELADAKVTQTDADGNVTQIVFTIPDIHADGVYVRMSSMGHANNAYLALDFVNAQKIASGFGSQGTELEKGVYTLPISMKNATDISKDSMAGACLKGASLTVKPDGSADVTVDLTAVSVMGQTAWSTDWQIYQGQDTDSELADAEVTQTDADGNVTQIVFTIPDIHADGVYVRMSSMGHANNAYLAFDFANAVKQDENSLEDGIYAVEGEMYKPDLATKSMADTAFNHNIMMTVKDGRATLTMNFKGMEITGLYGYLGSLKYYASGYQKDAYGSPVGELKDVTVESVQKYSDGVAISDSFGTNYPDVISFEVIPEALQDGIVPLQVFVPIMESITAGTGNQNVYLKLDLGNLKKTTAEDDWFKETEKAPDNPNGSTDINTPNIGGNTPAPSPITNTPVDSGKDTTPAPTVKVGQTVKVSGHTYKVTAKGKVTFTKCKSNAKSVTIPASVKVNGVTCKVTAIAKNAFKNNKKLTKVILGKNVTTVGKNAFKGCKKLKTVKLPKLTKKKTAALKKQVQKAGIASGVKVK